MSKNIKDGKMNVMGVNIDISQVLGEKIIDQYMVQLTEDEMKVVLDYISKDFLIKKTVHDYDYETQKYTDRIVPVVKEREKNSWGSFAGDKTIGEQIKERFNARIKEELMNKVEEIIKSSDYQEKIEEIANELIDYSVNGYKEDMKTRLKERLVGNVFNAEPMYCGVGLRDIVNGIINERMGY